MPTKLDRLGVARFLLVLCAVGAAVATVTDLPTVVGAPASSAVVESWRLVGLATFAALFLLLAWDPRNRTLFVIVIANKAALVAVSVALLQSPNGVDLVVFDGALAVLLLVAFLLTARTDQVIRETEHAHRAAT